MVCSGNVPVEHSRHFAHWVIGDGVNVTHPLQPHLSLQHGLEGEAEMKIFYGMELVG